MLRVRVIHGTTSLCKPSPPSDTLIIRGGRDFGGGPVLTHQAVSRRLIFQDCSSNFVGTVLHTVQFPETEEVYFDCEPHHIIPRRYHRPFAQFGRQKPVQFHLTPPYHEFKRWWPAPDDANVHLISWPEYVGVLMTCFPGESVKTSASSDGVGMY